MTLRTRALVSLCFIVVGACAAPTKPAATPPSQAAPNAAQANSQRTPVRTDVPRLSRAVTSFGAAVHGGALYLFGGYDGVPHAYSLEGQSGSLVRMDLAARTEQTLAVSEGVQGAQLVSTSQGLVRVGGMRAENAAGEAEQLVSLADVARFDERSATWQPLTALPEPRSSHAALVHRGELYVLGGWTLAGDRTHGTFASDALILDLESGRYRKLAQPTRRRAAQAAVLDGKIVLVGGLDEKGNPLRDIEVLDPETGSWTKGADFPADAFGVGVSGNGRTLFASARDGVVYRLDEPSGRWSEVAYLAFPRFFHQLAMLDDTKLVAVGGISGMHHGGRIAHAEVIDTESSAPRVLSWTLPSPSVAKNRQGVQVVGDQLIVFGGNRSLEQHDFGPEDFRADAFAIDLATMSVSEMPNFPVARQTVQTLALNDTLLAVGGFGHDGQKARAQADAYAYDFTRRAWEPHASVLPTPRTQFGLATRGDALWVFGGLDYDPSRSGDKQFFHPTTVLIAQRGQPFTTSEVEMPRPRRAFGGAALSGKYFMVGGMADGFAPVKECDAFDFEKTTWSTFQCPSAQRISPQLVPLDGRLFLAAGSVPGNGQELAPSRSLEVYDPAKDAWTTLLDTIPLEPRHLAVVPYRHALLMYSAHRADGAVQVALVVPPVHAQGEER